MAPTKILAACLEYIPSFEVGVRRPLLHLAMHNLIDLKVLRSCEIRRTQLEWCDVLIIARAFDNAEAEVVRQCRLAGKYVCYYLDDDLLNVPVGLRGNTYFRTQMARENIMSIMSDCHCLWTPNSILAEKYGYLFCNTAVIDAPALLLEYQTTQTRQREPNSPVTIGFAGGSSHEELFQELFSVSLKKLGDEFGSQLKFEIFGIHPALADQLPNCFCIAPTDSYKEYSDIMLSRNWDIALAPLSFTDFSACKYYNKFLEYGAMSIAGIYSDVPPFNLVIENGENGLLVENTEEAWYLAIRSLVLDPEKRKHLGENARKHLEMHNTLESIQSQLTASMPQLFHYGSEACPSLPNVSMSMEYPEFRVHFDNYRMKAISILQQNGPRGIIIVLKKMLHVLKRSLSRSC